MAGNPEPVRFAHHIGGVSVEPVGGAHFVSTNPANGRPWGTFAVGSDADVDRAVTEARAALDGPWGKLTPAQRGRLLFRWAAILNDQAESIARLETAQIGKLYRDALGQARSLQDWLYYYGGLADKIEGRVIPLERQTILNYTQREPLGVVAIITPWNSPTSLTMSAAAPALAAGNTIVVKPSEIASASLIALADLATKAGIPAGVFNVVTGMREAGEALIDHPWVAKVAFTGSVDTGRAVAQRAARRAVPCTLELGGKSPNIVFADADVAQAEAGVLGGIFLATGQTCVAGSRCYVQREIYDEFTRRLIERANRIVIGDPMADRTQMGPVATMAQLEKDETLVRRAIEGGATALCGGSRVDPDGAGGYFFEPTILADLSRDAEILHTEVFGPVLGIVPFTDEEDVAELANDTQFGLAAGLWTKDVRRAHRLARRLDVGTVWINMYRAFTVNSPMAARKASGLGVQNGLEAIDQYLQTKSVWCETSESYVDPFPVGGEARAAPRRG